MEKVASDTDSIVLPFWGRHDEIANGVWCRFDHAVFCCGDLADGIFAALSAHVAFHGLEALVVAVVELLPAVKLGFFAYDCAYGIAFAVALQYGQADVPAGGYLE